MRLAAVIICWDDWDLMDYCVDSIHQLVDEVIIVGSTRSNFGEYSPIPKYYLDIAMGNRNITTWIREPHFHIPMHSETDKRNYGLDIARDRGNTHFLMMDSDEFYEPEPFLKAKELFKNPNLKGLVCRCQTYFRNNLTMGLDSTLVPFIHELTPTIKHEFNHRYPFAWEGKQILIDPTRSFNINSGVDKIDLVMHHYSWLRADLEKKIRNSTARVNLQRSNILKQLVDPKAGDFIDFYQRSLVPATVDFKLDDTIFKNPLCKDIQPDTEGIHLPLPD